MRWGNKSLLISQIDEAVWDEVFHMHNAVMCVFATTSRQQDGSLCQKIREKAFAICPNCGGWTAFLRRCRTITLTGCEGIKYPRRTWSEYVLWHLPNTTFPGLKAADVETNLCRSKFDSAKPIPWFSQLRLCLYIVKKETKQAQVWCRQ